MKNKEKIPGNLNNRKFLIIIFITFLLGICSICSLWGAGSFLVIGDKVVESDAIVVLSGDEGDRIKEASKMYLAGLAEYIVITKSDHEEIQENQTNSEKMMRVAIDEGVASDAILFTDQESGDTIDEANQVLLVARQRNLNSLFIITDPYHTRRTKIIFDKIFKNSGKTIFVRGISNHWYKSGNWFLSLDGWRLTLGEYGAMLLLILGK